MKVPWKFSRKLRSLSWNQQCPVPYREESQVFRRLGIPEHFEEYTDLERELISLTKTKKRWYWWQLVYGISCKTSMNIHWNTAQRLPNRTMNNESEQCSDQWVLNFRSVAARVCWKGWRLSLASPSSSVIFWQNGLILLEKGGYAQQEICTVILPFSAS